MAVIKVKCDCGKLIYNNVGDRIVENRLRWYQYHNCDGCGAKIEVDDIGNMPHEVRRAIMEQEGRWRLCLNDLKDRIKSVYLLKKIPYFDLEVFKAFIEKQSDKILQGTKNEVLLVKNHLETKGKIECTIENY